jgi:membrane-associated phospholipid phosphatase
MTDETDKTFDAAAELPKQHEPLFPRIISAMLHPLLMGVYGVALLFLYTDFNILFSGQFLRFMTPVLFLTCIVPASSLYVMKRTGIIRDYGLTHRNDRLVPFITVFCSYGVLIYSFVLSGLYAWFISILVAPLILVLIAIVVTQKWKISAHMMGVGCLIGSTLSVCYNVKGLNPLVLFIILFILAGCLGVSRLILRRHTPAQVYAGFLIGIAVSYLCVLAGKYWAFITLYYRGL